MKETDEKRQRYDELTDAQRGLVHAMFHPTRRGYEAYEYEVSRGGWVISRHDLEDLGGSRQQGGLPNVKPGTFEPEEATKVPLVEEVVVIERDRHALLLRNPQRIAQRANIPMRLLFTSAVGIVTDIEYNWFKGYHTHAADGTGAGDHHAKAQAPGTRPVQCVGGVSDPQFAARSRGAGAGPVRCVAGGRPT